MWTLVFLEVLLAEKRRNTEDGWPGGQVGWGIMQDARRWVKEAFGDSGREGRGAARVILSKGLGSCNDQGPWQWFKQVGSLVDSSFSCFHGSSSSNLPGVDLIPSAPSASLQGSLPHSTAAPVNGPHSAHASSFSIPALGFQQPSW